MNLTVNRVVIPLSNWAMIIPIIDLSNYSSQKFAEIRIQLNTAIAIDFKYFY